MAPLPVMTPPVLTTSVPVAPAERPLLRMIAATTAGVVGTSFLRTLTQALAASFDAHAAFVAEHVDEDGDRAMILASWGRDGIGAPEGSTYLVADTPCQRALVQDLVQIPEGACAAYPKASVVAEHGLDSYLAVVIRGHDGARIGHIGVMARTRLDPSEEEIDALRIFAARLGGIQRRASEARAAAARVRIVDAADAERARIGRDLHDGAQQDLVVLCHAIDDARRALGDGAPEVQALLVRAREQAERAGRDLRALAHGLRPVGLREDGLDATLRRLVARCPLPVSLAALPPEPLPEPVELAVYYVVAEALTNAVKHAGAGAVQVVVTVQGGAVHVTVQDDGAGGAVARPGSGPHRPRGPRLRPRGHLRAH